MDDELKSDWKYKSPIELGYKQFKLTKKQHNELFPKRQLKWNQKYEYYYNEHQVLMHRFTNKYAKIFATLAFPIFVLIHGVVNWSDIIKEYRDLYNEKKYGSYVGETVRNKSETYDEIMRVLWGVNSDS